MIRETVEVKPRYRVHCVEHIGPFGTPKDEQKVQYQTEAEAYAALEARMMEDLAELHQRGVLVLAEERSLEDQAIQYHYSSDERSLGAILMYDVQISHFGPLYDADDACEHFLVQNMSGIHCLDCTGWYRSGARR